MCFMNLILIKDDCVVLMERAVVNFIDNQINLCIQMIFFFTF